METMGERIAKARMYMNLNQRELAKNANIAEPTLSRYENGYREPKAGTISQIAEALGISADYILGITDTIEVINKDENNLVAIEDMFDDMNITLHNSSCLLYGKPVSDKTIENIVSAMKGAILLSIQEEKERELQNKSKDK